MLPSSRRAASLKPSVAYLVLNFWALWKKQTFLPSLAYAGMPYQSFGARAGALAWMTACSRLAIARSVVGSPAILASTSLSPSALSAREPRRPSTFISWTRSCIAAFSSAVNPSYLFLVAVLLADFCLAFTGGFLPESNLIGTTLMLGGGRCACFFKSVRSSRRLAARPARQDGLLPAYL